MLAKKFTWRKPSWLSIIATIFGIVMFSVLGVWQLQRAEQKNQLLLEHEQRNNGAPQELALPIVDPATLRFQRIRLQGKFLSTRQFVLDNKMHQHQVGYNILTPFVLDNSGAVVLVDRGWLPIGESRAKLPEVSIDEQPRAIIGSVYVPFGEPYHLGGIDNGESTWPRLIQYLNFDALATRLQLDLLPITLRLEANQAGGYTTEWPLFAFTAKRHLGYAVQWFALALTALVIFLLLHLSRRKAT